jgi:hypothetical protein
VGHPVWPHSGLDSTTFLVGFRVEKVEAKRIKGPGGLKGMCDPWAHLTCTGSRRFVAFFFQRREEKNRDTETWTT